MSRVESPILTARPALAELLGHWPVLCQMAGEENVSSSEEPLQNPSLAVVTNGVVWVRFSGSRPERLETGQLLVAHEVDGVSLSSSAPDDSEHASLNHWPGDDPVERPSVLIIRLKSIGTQFSPGLMPRPFLARFERPAEERLSQALVESVQSDLVAPVVNAIATALYLQVLHEHLQTRPREVPILTGLFDAEIGPVVTALLRSPAKDWTVESLADVGGMSRSAFARKFRDLMGTAPIDFLVEVRMWQAARQLRQQSQDLKSIAREVGYLSPAAFSVAFKRWSGATPSDYRRES